MFACRQLTVRPPGGGAPILEGAEAVFRAGALNAVIGPSGCGKTTLVKAMLGLMPADGEVWLDGGRVRRSEDLRGRMAFAPQFSLAHDRLTVAENLRYALDLLVAETAVKAERLETVLEWIGLVEHRDTAAGDLSGGQKRRLGLGLELLGDPRGMVCDEVTTGLDPNSEDRILEMLRRLRDERGKTFVCIIHNLEKLETFDRITVVYGGSVVFQGSPAELKRYFGITDVLHLYERLDASPAAEWRRQWATSESRAPFAKGASAEAALPAPRPSATGQAMTLLRRRSVLFRRDRGYWLLTLGITLGFPVLVAVFALDGLPQLRGLAMGTEAGFVERMEANLRYRVEAMETASLVTGLILFQVILLTLMASNNGAREIAAERELYEKERFAGLRPPAYVASKLVFTSGLALAQGLWMTLFVKYVCGFPGPLGGQAAILMLCCVAMTSVCLGFSANASSPDKASLLSVYLVGFQLPLSGVVLALPEVLVWVCRPFINAYWGWAGYFGTMIETRLYDAYRMRSAEWVPEPAVAGLVLAAHFAAGAAFAFWGCHKKKWA